MSLLGELYESRKEFDAETKLAIFTNAGFKCEGCGKELDFDHHKDGQKGAWEAHHVVPATDGGNNTVANGAALCLRCHKYVTNSTEATKTFALQLFKQRGYSERDIRNALNRIT